MKAEGRIRLFEIVLYALILVAAMSVMLYTGRSIRGDWDGAAVDWLRLLPFLFIFAVNNFLLCPKLLFKERYYLYLLCCVALIALAVPLAELARQAVDGFCGPFHPEEMFPGGEMPGDMPAHHGFRGPYGHHGPPPWERMLGLSIVALLLIGFNSGVKVFVHYAQEKITRGEREQQYLATELAYLKNQISPHFLMNTLNNIHALVDIDSGRAQDAIVKLSRMMRYLLYESEPDMVPLQREIGFIESYLELMGLRYASGEVEMDFKATGATEGVMIPAFLFLPFIENAFKHGILSDGGSYLKIDLRVGLGRLRFSVENSVGDRRASLGEGSGIGIENIRKRLAILYGDRYSLDIFSDGAKHEVKLEIPV